MGDKSLFDLVTPNPLCIGTGLVALDIVINGKKKASFCHGLGGLAEMS